MPLIYNQSFENEGQVAIWRMDEELEFFQSSMYLYDQEKEEIKDLSYRKLQEWYASRYLLHLISGNEDRGACVKDNHGKPFIEGSPHHISLSHSGDWIAVAASLPRIGVDVQHLVMKITRIAHKFASSEELEYVEEGDYILGLHMIWGAKESMYKAYGKRNLDFKINMKVEPFKPGLDITTRGQLIIDDVEMSFLIHAQQIDKYVLVYAMEIVDQPADDQPGIVMQKQT